MEVVLHDLFLEDRRRDEKGRLFYRLEREKKGPT